MIASDTTATPRLTAREAADRLGVKVATVYAYVSRGHLERETAPDGRTSTFDPDAVDALARRGRPRRSSRAPTLDLELTTAVTDVRQGHLRYRGFDAVGLSRRATFEGVCELLWAGTSEDLRATWASADPVPVPDGTDLDRLRSVAVWAAADDPTAADLHPSAVAATARRLIATMVASLPSPAPRTPRLRLGDRTGPGEGAAIPGSIAGGLSTRLGAGRPPAVLVRWINSALCLLADHELAASTLAARVAASARADPYGVVIAGLGPFGGALHGTASRQVRDLLERAERSGAGAAVAHALRSVGAVPGFGHPLYPAGDPRAVELLRLLEDADPRRMGTVRAVQDLASTRTGVHPNVDFALGAAGHVHRLGHDAGDAVFGVARSGGWVAHAIEEYAERPLRFRPRARYLGEPPRPLPRPASDEV